MALSSDEFVANATQTANGTKMPPAELEGCQQIFPSHSRRRRSRRDSPTRYTPLIAQAQMLMFQSRELGSLRDLILPKLVTGQIDVSSLAVMRSSKVRRDVTPGPLLRGWPGREAGPGALEGAWMDDRQRLG